MRSIIAMCLVLGACAESPAPGAPAAGSVRERLAQPTRLLVTAPASSGSITASRYTHDGWQDGTTPITIDNGELDATVADGQLEVKKLAVSPQPIEIPQSVFGEPVEIKDIHLELARTPDVATSWNDDNDATATAMIDLDLSWTIVVNGAADPLATQHLTGIPLDVTLTGSGQEVDATIAANATGDLWSWAGLFKLTALQLTLSATTAY